MLAADSNDMERKFSIEPPANGNAFRVLIDQAHKKGPATSGRFDLWVVKNTEYKAKELDATPQMAMMELGGVFSAKSIWSAGWNKPRLDSKTGIANAAGT